MTRSGKRDFGRRALAAAAWGLIATATFAQTAQDDDSSPSSLDLPQNLKIFGKVDPNVRKPTAVVNDTVITGTDIDQRVALFALANKIPLASLPAGQRDQLRLRVLQQLIDETLQIQEAKSDKITVTPEKIDQAYARVARNFDQSSAQFGQYLRNGGSSDKSIRRQIEGELAWSDYLRRNVEPFVNVSDDEVNSILEGLKAAKGTEEYNLKEIYLTTNGSNDQQVEANARQMIAAMQKGEQPFEYFAHTFSEASTRAQNGDLGWVRGARLPTELAAAVQQMQPGQIAGPVPVPGGLSILYLADKRSVLGADPRDARLSLKQLTVHFPSNTTEAQATPQVSAFAKAVQQIRGCGSAGPVAKQLNAEVVDKDGVRLRELPPQLQEILLKLQVGEASPPYGSVTEGVHALVVCGRDEAPANELPGSDQIQSQLQEQRVNLRAQQKLRDLRRDAVIDYR